MGWHWFNSRYMLAHIRGMTFRFKRYRHRPTWPYWLRWFPWLINTTEIKRSVVFSTESKYWLHTADQQDWNKLFGISFTISPHRNSARYGWRYNPEINKFQLCAYCYLNGESIMEPLCDLQVNHVYLCHIIITNEDYLFRVYRRHDMAVMCSTAISKGHRKKNGYLLGPYFGGNNAAPDDIKIQLSKFKP